MSTNEKNSGVDEKEIYNSPELVRLGDATEITGGADGWKADSPPKPGGAGFYDPVPETKASPNPERLSETSDPSPDAAT